MGNAANGKERHAALTAVREGDTQRLERLLKKDAAAVLGVRSDEGAPLLMVALERRCREAAELLLQAGADKDARDNEGNSPLSLAIANDDRDAVDMLLRAGADKDARGRQGSSPLIQAIRDGRTDVVRILLRAGADKDARDRAGTPPVIVAAENRRVEALEQLLQAGADKEARDAEGNSALIMATKKRHVEAVAALLRGGADPDAKDRAGDSPLVVAVRNRHVELVDLLLRSGAQKEARDRNGDSLLIIAARSNYKDVIDMLLRAGVQQRDAKDTTGNTALAVATKSGFAEVAETLLRGGAQKDARDAVGDTPLMAAVALRHAPLVELLLREGANVEARNLAGESALVMAAKRGFRDMVDMLLQAGVDKEGRDARSWTPLMWAAHGGHCEATEAMLELGANADAVSTVECEGCAAGSTALAIAATRGHSDAVFSLLRLGADPTVRNANGLTAADVAREGPSKQLALVALLAWGRMQASADRARAEELRTQLDEARRSVSELEQKALASEARAVRAERSEKEALRALSVQAPQAEFEEVKDPTEIIEKMSFIHDLGAGNTSRVHPGVWHREPVAVKVSPTGLTEKQLDALHAEAELHGRIGQHPRIVKLLAFAIDRSKRRALLVLRLAKNGSLKDALERKRFAGSGDTLLLVRVLFEAAEGFAFLHSIGILHRDIACRNILLDEGDHALVSDLGFARKLAANAEYYKAAPLTQRPFQWMAPEEHEHNRFDFASDVYMFGMTMWEALSRGRRFFDSNDPETVKAKIVAGERPRPLEPALCPPSVGALIERCTAHDPKARPSMKDVATELDRVLSQELKNSAHIAGRDDVQRFEQNSSAALMFFVQRIDRRLNEILDH